MSMFDKRQDNQSDVSTGDTNTPPGLRPRLPESVSAAREVAAFGATITINGNVTGEESLVIDGRVNGAVVLHSHDLTISQSGQVTANATANSIRIEGELTGDICGVERVVITRTGRVRGSVVAPRVTLEDGAKFKGSIDMDPGTAKPASSAHTLRSASTRKPSGK